MTWLQRYRVISFLRNSIWLPPLLGVAAALIMHPLIRWMDAVLGWKSVVDSDGARAVLGTLVSSLLAFIVFVFSILFVAVLLARARLSPQINAAVYRDRVFKFSLALFVFAFVYSLVALIRIEGALPKIDLSLAVYSGIASVGVCIYMIDHLSRLLRPAIFLARTGDAGQEVIQKVYPRRVAEPVDRPTNVTVMAEREPSHAVVTKRTGFIIALDAAGLADLARRSDLLIELIPQIGNRVTSGDPLFRIYGSGQGITDSQLEDAVAIGPQRAMDQDPEYAFRIIVDAAAKALSPGVNDPSTAIIAIDQIGRLLGEVGNRQLETGRVHDNAGELRLAYSVPSWQDFVHLGVAEIRHFGRDSVQLSRCMRYMLEHLIKTLPPPRAALLRAELEFLSQGIEDGLRDPGDRIRGTRRLRVVNRSETA